MNYSIMLSAAVMALALSACDKPTVVTPAPVVVTPAPGAVAVPVPGPAGPQGAPGEPGKAGAPGGDTVVIVPPAEPQKR